MWGVGKLADIQMSYGERGRLEQIKRGAPPEKIVVLSTAIDERKKVAVRDSITTDEVENFKAQMGIVEKKILLHVVRLTRIKRPDLMVQAFAILAKERNDVELVWIGGGPLEEEIKQKAKAMGIDDRMRFLGPIYDEHTLALWFKSADVFVMATCIGLSMHHAMCYGLPVVTDDNERTQTSEFEVLIDGVNGLAYRSGDLDDFAENMEKLLDDNEFRSRLSANAIKRIETEFTFDKKIEKFATAIDRLFQMRDSL